ncbi:hypothetical protein ASF04_19455 [Duganella sp. Leaf61]|uniref:MCP four helix bundle domain-containing protein n=1 Tax=Duganella sp. Leaf61 TaxID=1736227 RepID=UPI0006F8E4DF|nr:methyl-accepting chemotaxis protein [Duganella sp. Leaf61]KQN65784.1 hypothetical protein ASF04_19455 [Duganella sp. Leaf61]
MLNKLRIGPKLLLAPGIVLVLLLILAAGAYLGMARQNQSLDNIMQERAVRLKAVSDLVAGTSRAHTEAYQLLTWLNAGFTFIRTDELVRATHARHASLERQFARLERITQTDPAERRFVVEAQAAYGQYVKAVADALDIAIDDHAIAANAMSKAGRAFDVVAQRLEQLSLLEQALGERDYRAAEADFLTLSLWMPALVAAAVGLALLVTIAVRKALLTEVRAIGAAAVDLAEGNLAVKNRKYGGDEIAATARALDTSVRNLNTTLKTILALAQALDAAAHQVARSSAEVRARAERQAASLQQASGMVRALGADDSTNGYGDACAAIVEVDRVTQQSLARVRQAALDAGNLQHQAGLLSAAVARFKLEADDDAAGGAAADGVAVPVAGVPRVVRLRLASVRN